MASNDLNYELDGQFRRSRRYCMCRTHGYTSGHADAEKNASRTSSWEISPLRTGYSANVAGWLKELLMDRSAGNTLPADAPPPKRATFGGRMSRRRCHQEGSLFKRGTRKKVWVARWWEEAIGSENKIERIRRSEVLGTIAEIPTKREAQQLLDDLLRRTNSGEHRPQAILTFKSFVEDRWKPDLYPTLKFSSRKFYDNMVDTHLIPVFGNTQLRLITKDAVQSFLNAKAQSGSSWKTVKLIRTAFGGIIEAAVRDDLLTSNPVRKTRLPRQPPLKTRFRSHLSPSDPAGSAS